MSHSIGIWGSSTVAFREVTAVVGQAPEKSSAWYRDLAGEERAAVEVRLPDGRLMYLDNEDGSGVNVLSIQPGDLVPAYRLLAIQSVSPPGKLPVVGQETIAQPPAEGQKPTPAEEVLREQLEALQEQVAALTAAAEKTADKPKPRAKRKPKATPKE